MVQVAKAFGEENLKTNLRESKSSCLFFVKLIACMQEKSNLSFSYAACDTIDLSLFQWLMQDQEQTVLNSSLQQYLHHG